MYGHKRDESNSFNLGLVFMANDNVDNENWWDMTQEPFVNLSIVEMAKAKKINFYNSVCN